MENGQENFIWKVLHDFSDCGEAAAIGRMSRNSNNGYYLEKATKRGSHRRPPLALEFRATVAPTARVTCSYHERMTTTLKLVLSVTFLFWSVAGLQLSSPSAPFPSLPVQEVELEGILDVYIADSFGDHNHDEEQIIYLLRESSGQTHHLDLGFLEPALRQTLGHEALQTGASVRVKGHSHDHKNVKFSMSDSHRAAAVKHIEVVCILQSPFLTIYFPHYPILALLRFILYPILSLQRLIAAQLAKPETASREKRKRNTQESLNPADLRRVAVLITNFRDKSVSCSKQAIEELMWGKNRVDTSLDSDWDNNKRSYEVNTFGEVSFARATTDAPQADIFGPFVVDIDLEKEKRCRPEEWSWGAMEAAKAAVRVCPLLFSSPSARNLKLNFRI